MDRDRSRLVQIYRDRGLSGDLPEQVADQLLAHDPLHARFEAEHGVAEPPSSTHATLQSLDAAIAFTIGSLLPLLISAFLPGRIDAWATVLVVVASLTVTSVVAARHNGAPVWRTVLRSVAVGVASLTVSSIAGSVLQPRSGPLRNAPALVPSDGNEGGGGGLSWGRRCRRDRAAAPRLSRA